LHVIVLVGCGMFIAERGYRSTALLLLSFRRRRETSRRSRPLDCLHWNPACAGMTTEL